MTIHKFGPEDLADFTLGETVTIEDFRYETACAIFGQPLVDSYYEWKRNPPKAPAGKVTVVSIDTKASTVTFGEPNGSQDG